MNEQRLPIDIELSGQLARRASGKMPDGLVADVMQAVDAAQERPNAWHLPRIGTRSPQFALSAVSGIFASILIAVLVIAPFMQWQAAGSAYPAERALSTAELANLMSGTALATNTAIVASATIDADPNACPMDRYRTLGVVEAMGSQVCVMEAGTYTGLTGSKSSGVWAFRYLAPGILGLLGQVSPASGAKLAYGATDQWPLAGKVFLVDGWLGSDGLCEIGKWVDPEPGDVLNPTGPETCAQSWISDKSSPNAFKNAAIYHSPPVATPSAVSGSAASTGGDTVAQVEDLYWVGAGGTRYYDDVPGKYNPPVHGTWAVKSSVGPCPNDPPTSSRGCGFWLVLARVTDLLTEPAPTAFVPTPSPTVAISGMRDSAATPLTTTELGLALKAGIPNDNIVIATTTIADSTSCTTNGTNIAIGAIPGLVPEVCVLAVNDADPAHSPADRTGTFAFKVLAPRLLGYVATVDRKPQGGAYTPDDAWPAGKSIAVSGWITPNPGNDPLYAKCEGLIGEAAGSLDPRASYCSAAELASSATSSSGVFVAQALTVDEVHAIQDAGKPGAPRPAQIYPAPGSWLLQPFKPDGSGPKPIPSATGLAACCTWQISGKIEPVGLAGVAPTPPAESPSPLPTPGATPTPLSLTGQPIQRAMTTAEFAAVMAGPAPAIGTTFVATVTVGPGGCGPGVSFGAIYGLIEGMGSSVCLATGGALGPDAPISRVTGTFAMRYMSAGMLINLGRVEPVSSCGLVFSPSDKWPADIFNSHTFLVGGYLGQEPAGWVITAASSGSSAFMSVVLDTDAGFTSIDQSRYGVFVVTSEPTPTPGSSTEPPGDGVAFHVRAWVAGTTGPSAVPSTPASVCGPAPTIPR